jgi:hypothetical protein
MSFKTGDTGVITFGNGTTSRVRISKIHNYSFMPTDYVMTYMNDETNRPLIHPDFVTYNDGDKIDSFPLPEGLLEQVFIKD